MTGIALTSFFAGYDLVSPWFIAVVLLLIGGSIVSQLQNSKLVDPWGVALTVVLLASGVLATYLQRDAGEIWQKTAVLLMYPAMYSMLMLIRPGAAFLYWLVPVGLGHAFMIIVQALLLDIYRPTGLTDSANPAGGLLALLAIVTIQSRWWPLAVPMIFAMVLTGSRLAVLAFSLALLVSLVTRRTKLVPAAISVFLVGGLSLIFMPTVSEHLFHRGGAIAAAPEASYVAQEVGYRLNAIMPSVVPYGVNAYSDPIHSLFLSVAVEYGIIALIAILGMLAIALYRIRRSPLIPSAMVLIVLASLDLYLWIGPMAWAWWWFLSADWPGANHSSPLQRSSPSFMKNSSGVPMGKPSS